MLIAKLIRIDIIVDMPFAHIGGVIPLFPQAVDHQVVTGLNLVVQRVKVGVGHGFVGVRISTSQK